MAHDNHTGRILYIEDDTALTFLMKRILSRAGYDVDIANDGGTGLLMYESKIYDVLLVDNKLPTMTGLEILRRLNHDLDNRIPIIILTADGDEDLVSQALSLGASDFVIKDVEGTFTRLMPVTIKKVLHHHHFRKEKVVAEKKSMLAASRFQNLVENISDIICVVSAQGTVGYLSPSGHKFIGKAHHNETTLDFIHLDDRSQILNKITELSRRRNGSITLSLRIKHHTDEWHWFEGTATNLLTEPSIHGIVVNLHNVNSLQQSQQALEQERNTLRTLIDAIPDRISVKNRQGDVILMNQQSRAELAAVSNTDSLSLDDTWHRLSHRLDLQVIHEQSAILGQEEKVDDKWYRINKIPLQDAAGDVSGIVSIESDITARKSYEQNILLHNQQLLGLQVASSKITSSFDLSEIMQALAQEIVKITHYEICSISRWDKDNKTLETIIRHTATGNMRLPVNENYVVSDDSVVLSVLQSWVGVQLTVNDPTSDAELRQEMVHDGVQSLTLIPIIYDNEAIALAKIEDTREEKILQSHKLLVVELLLHQAGIAFENSDLYEKAQAEIAQRQRAEIALVESEEKLRSTVSSLDDLLFTIDEKGYFLEYFQPIRASSKLYMPPELFLGKHYQDVLPPHNVAKLDEAIEQLNLTGEVQQIDYPMITADDEFWFSAKLSLRYDAKGASNGFTVIARDITQTKLAQEDVRRKAHEIELSSRRYQALFEQSHDAILIMDENGKYIAVNQRAVDVFGYSQDEFLDLSFLSLFPQDDATDASAMVYNNSDFEDAPSILEYHFAKKDGTVFPAECLIEFVWDDKGEILHIQSIVRDITERKRFELFLFKQQERLQALHTMATTNLTTAEEVLVNALKIACELLEMEAGIISQIQGGQYKIQYIHTTELESLKAGTILPVEETFCDLVYKEESLITIAHASADETFSQHQCYVRLNIESFIGEPLRLSNAVYGTLSFVSTKPRSIGFNQADESFIRLMAQWVASVLERDSVERNLRQSEERFRVMFEMAPIGIYLMTLDGVIRRANSAFTTMLGYKENGLTNTDIELLLHPDESIGALLEGTTQEQGMYHNEQRFITKQGQVVYVLLRAIWLQTTIQEPFYLMGQVIDITERKLAYQELASRINQLELLHQVETELTQTLDIDSVFRLAVDTAMRFSMADYGYIALKMNQQLTMVYYIGTPDANMHGRIIPEGTISWRVLKNQTGELINNVRQDPDYVSSWDGTKAQITLPLTSSGRELGILGLETEDPENFTQETFDFLTLISRRISSAIDNAELFAQTQDQLGKLTALHERLMHQATHDPLTGLPNRALFQERLDDGILSAQASNEQIGLLYIDIDGFKGINDTLGHPIGDKVLIEVGERLRACLREEDTVARMGGDEFTVILPSIPSKSQAYDVARRILAAIREPFILLNASHYISASIGLSFYPFDGRDSNELLRKADTALYTSKGAGKNMFNTYDTITNRAVIESVLIGNLLHQVLDNKELSIHYQPQVALKTGKVVGVEALLRWNSPIKGRIGPDKFLPIAMEVGMLIPITNWVFSEVCRQQDEWWQAGIQFTMSVNIAIPQFQQEEFVKLIMDIADQYDFPNESIELEMTEQLMLKNLEQAAEKIKQLRTSGFKIALDDFGTGYSSLSYLQKLPIDTLKIDRSLIMDIDSDDETSIKSTAIIKAIFSLASTLGVRLIAEGVETVSQSDHLRDLGVHISQGYLVSKALPPKDFETWYATYQAEKQL